MKNLFVFHQAVVLILIAYVKLALCGAQVYSGLGSDYFAGQTQNTVSNIYRTVMDVDMQTDFNTGNQIVGGVLSTSQCSVCGFLYFIEKQTQTIKWHIQLNNWKVGAVAFSGTSVVAIVYVQRQVNQVIFYTETVVLIKDAASKTDTTLRADLYQISLADYSSDHFPLALLPLSSYDYLIVHAEGIIRRVTVQQNNGQSEFQYDGLYNDAKVIQLYDAKLFRASSYKKSQSISTYLSVLAKMKMISGSYVTQLQIFTIDDFYLSSLIAINVSVLDYFQDINPSPYDGRLDTYTNLQNNQTSFFISISDPNQDQNIALIKVLYQIGSSSYSVTNIKLNDFNQCFKVLALSATQSVFLLSQGKLNTQSNTYLSDSLTFILMDFESYTDPQDLQYLHPLKVDSIDLKLDAVSISAIIGWNDGVLFSYIFGKSLGFGSTLDQNYNLHSFCGYIVQYIDSTSTFNNFKLTEWELIPVDYSFRSDEFTIKQYDMYSFSMRDYARNSIVSISADSLVGSAFSWSYISNSVPKYATETIANLVLVLNLAPKFLNVKQQLYAQCDYISGAPFCFPIQLPNVLDPESNLPVAFDVICIWASHGNCDNDYFYIVEFTDSGQTSYRVDYSLKFQALWPEWLRLSITNQTDFIVQVTIIDSVGIQADSLEFEFIFSDQQVQQIQSSQREKNKQSQNFDYSNSKVQKQEIQFQSHQASNTLTKDEIKQAYDRNGILTIDKTQSRVESNNKFFFQFSRDLYWKESLVATFIPHYKRIDPEQEYLAEKINILTQPTSTQSDSKAKNVEALRNYQDEKQKKNYENQQIDAQNKDQEIPGQEQTQSDSFGNQRLLESYLLEKLILLKVIDSKEQEVTSIIIKEKKVTNVTSNSMKISVEYENQALIKQNYIMQVYLNFSSFEKNWNDSIPFIFTLNPSIETKQVRKSSSKSIFKAGASVGTIILSTIMMGSLAQLWGLINGLQLIVHLPLILKATFPDQTQTVLDQIITIAQFDLIDSRAWIFEGMLQMEIPEENQNFFQENLTRVKYDGEYTVLNLGSSFLLFVIFFIEASILFFLKPVANCSQKFKIIHDRLSKALYWSQFIRLIIESSIDISVSLINNIYVEYLAYQNGEGIKWLPQSIFYWINLITAAGCLVILIVGPLFILIFYLCRFSDWKSESFQTRFGSPLSGLCKDQKSSIFYPTFLIVRRAILVFVCITMSDYFTLQLIVVIYLTLVQIFYLLTCRPFEDQKSQHLEVMNEVLNLILQYHVFALNSDWVSDQYTKEVVGQSFIFFIVLAITVHFFFFIRSIIKDQEEAIFKRSTKANKCCLRLCTRFSKRIQRQQLQFAQQRQLQETVRLTKKINQVISKEVKMREQELRDLALEQIQNLWIIQSQRVSIQEQSRKSHRVLPNEITKTNQKLPQKEQQSHTTQKLVSMQVTQEERQFQLNQISDQWDIEDINFPENPVYKQMNEVKGRTKKQQLQNEMERVLAQVEKSNCYDEIYSDLGLSAQEIEDLVSDYGSSQVKLRFTESASQLKIKPVNFQ